jgi:hypothetical protein
VSLSGGEVKRIEIRMETQNYDVKIFAEWWEATGFWLKEAIFAYIPQTLVTAVASEVSDAELEEGI